MYTRSAPGAARLLGWTRVADYALARTLQGPSPARSATAVVVLSRRSPTPMLSWDVSVVNYSVANLVSTTRLPVEQCRRAGRRWGCLREAQQKGVDRS